MSTQLWASSAWMRRKTFHSSEFLEYESMKTTSAFAPARSASSMRFRKSVSMKLDVLVLQREVVDAALGRSDPAGHPAGLDHLLHQRMHERLVGFARDPVGKGCFIQFPLHEVSLRVHGLSRPGADRAPEARRRQAQAEIVRRALDHAVPALQADLAVLEIGLAHHFVQRIQHRHVGGALRRDQVERSLPQYMIFILALVRTSIQAAGGIGSRVGRDLRAEMVVRGRTTEVE